MRARQKALSALENQIAELTQQLRESGQSQVQLEQQLESDRGLHAEEAAKAQVSGVLHLAALYQFSL